MISKAENPEKMLNQLLIDMNEQMIESKKAVAMAIADEKKLERDALENKRQAEDWEKKAMLAVRSNRDDLAKEALLRKQEYAGYAASFQKEYESQHTSVEQLKDALRQLQAEFPSVKVYGYMDDVTLASLDPVRNPGRARRPAMRYATPWKTSSSFTNAWKKP